ncbi:MAG TPA: ATP-binding protein [Chthoniobacteraceae bacterium]|jgi:two-component system cell cycle sensor histidine kinase/response regulator CckA|nr:ATP-binding protein [Chthoniobacteraceae bacterium]
MRIEQSEFHDHLVRGLTHKMNNILSLFHGYLGLLIDDKKLDRETMAGLLRIRESADAAAKLMDRTKALAPSSNALWRQVAPEEFLRTLTPALQLYTERGVKLEVTCDPGLTDLWADTSRLRMAMKEIVKNACEASPANGLVQISAKPHARAVRTRGRRPATAPMAWTVITVTDSGKGIPAELQTKIFQPFFSTKNKRDSVGLGLSVALGLVQQLGGAIRLQSRPGKTAVKVLLPSRTAA